ncbi:vacuolar ATPase assembly integral membrane protein vma21-like [Oppia nitens]|uniref:vacuolar ATPase assembly integral membrane protein vma21-like n=1 Tax=Oppia nitens TaxID=1686743 RepID=UPI0023DB935E|nr:vacuolar ATPase assembly integral membrane protein vma21-like [Oppia nitens]
MADQIGDRNPLITLVYYSIAMVTCPIGGYFLSRPLFELVTSGQSVNIYSAITAVIIVHIILFMFVYIAYNEDKKLATTTSSMQPTVKVSKTMAQKVD